MDNASRQLFDGIDLSLPDEQFAEWLEHVLDQRVEIDSDDNSIVTISADEIALLQKWSRDAGPKTRRVAVEFLVHYGPCGWDDVEAWVLDSDEAVRSCAMDDVHTFGELTVGGRLCRADKKRWIDLIASAAERYPEECFSAIDTLRWFAVDGDEWLEHTWNAANRLLDLNNVDLNTSLIVSYFEDVVWQLGWGPENSYLQPWIRGKDGWRQIILLRIATWLNLDEGRMREIVQALTQSKVKDVAILAQGVLDGRVGYADL